MPEPTGRSAYARTTVAVDAYPGSANVSWVFAALGIIINNTGANPLLFSHDGSTDHGRIEATEALTFEFKAERKLYFKRASGVASNDVDVTVWG